MSDPTDRPRRSGRHSGADGGRSAADFLASWQTGESGAVSAEEPAGAGTESPRRAVRRAAEEAASQQEADQQAATQQAVTQQAAAGRAGSGGREAGQVAGAPVPARPTSRELDPADEQATRRTPPIAPETSELAVRPPLAPLRPTAAAGGPDTPAPAPAVRPVAASAPRWDDDEPTDRHDPVPADPAPQEPATDHAEPAHPEPAAPHAPDTDPPSAATPAADGEPEASGESDPGHPAWDETGGLEVLGAGVLGSDVLGSEVPGSAPADGRPPRGRGAGGGRRPGRRRGPRRVFTVVASLLVLAGLVVGIVLGGQWLIGKVNPTAADYPGQGSGEVQIRVATGDSLSAIARTLAGADVVASPGSFVTAASANPAATGIQPGVYGMRLQMSGQAALDLLLDPASRLFSRVTIPEGFTVQDTLQRLSEATDTPLADLQAAAADTSQLGLPAWAGGQLEGFLYPLTYDFEPDTTPTEMLTEMVGQFTTTAASISLEQRAAAAGRSPYDVLIVASMVQSETLQDAERVDVAQVIYNRLARGMTLGIDATIAYGLDKNGNDLTVTDLTTDGPYNTRTRTGLPPTPISAPGEASLEAALSPSTGDLLYYVLQDSAGNHFFTDSDAEFEAARQRCAAAGLGCGSG